MRTLVAVWMCAACALVSAHAAPAGTGSGKTLLYVDNSLSDDISVIDLGSLKVAGTIQTGKQPHGLCAPADGRRLFVTVESENNLKIVDTATGKITDTIALGGRPNECAVTPNGRYVGVPIRNGDRVAIIDTSAKKVVKELPVKTPHNCFNAGSNNDLYVSSMGSNEIDEIDLQKMEFSAHIPTGGIPRPYAVSSDEKTLYSAITNLHGFVIASIPERKVLSRVELPPAPPLNCALEPNTPTHGLALSPDGKDLWVTSLADGGVYVYNTVTRQTSSMIPVGKCPNWISVSPDGKYVAVSNSDSNDASVIDAGTRREAARLKVGSGPKRVLVVHVQQ